MTTAVPGAVVAPADGAAPWWSGSVDAFLALDDAVLRDRLAARAMGRFRVNEAAQLRAWFEQAAMLRLALRELPGRRAMRLLLEFEVLRLGRRMDAVLLGPRGIVVIEFKVGAATVAADDLRQVDGYALDLQDVHAGSRGRVIVPLLVATEAEVAPATLPLLIGGAVPPMVTNRDGFAATLHRLMAALPDTGQPVLVEAWEAAPYRPVPNVIEAACRLYGRHDVRDIASARADAENLTRTAERIAAILAEARQGKRRVVVFVTGIPGGGKTLCGLNAAFSTRADGGDTRATFLTGNPTLVHVLRAALVDSAVAQGSARTMATSVMEKVIQALPRFRDLYVGRGDEVPPERVVVIDEAQRSWTARHAVSKTRDRPVRLVSSEPAHLLDIMTRHDGFAAMVCLIGGGQEIHDGEGGLACWGEALRERPVWDVFAAPAVLAGDGDARSRLPPLAGLRLEPSLHLDVAVRSLRQEATPRWVEAVLRGDRPAASRIAADAGGVPFFVCRDLDVLRQELRRRARERHRAGLVASAGAARLRAEGLGCELPHTDATAVAHWFLRSWERERDVRASDALETVGTQFSVQGLELDQVGLCWDGDLIREGVENGGWRVRSFRGTAWQRARDPDKVAWRINTYRVLLTRARYDTVIWVPRGDPGDPSREPAMLDGVARFLLGCGAREVRAPEATGADGNPAIPLFSDAGFAY